MMEESEDEVQGYVAYFDVQDEDDEMEPRFTVIYLDSQKTSQTL